MGIETRKGRGAYYTRSKKVNGRVVREYVGSGPIALFTALLDEEEREERAAKAAAERAETERKESLDVPVQVLCSTLDALTRGLLADAGYHQHHRGEWRRCRGVR